MNETKRDIGEPGRNTHESYIELAGAIIQQAAQDYETNLTMLILGIDFHEERIVRNRAKQKKKKEKKLRKKLALLKVKPTTAWIYKENFIRKKRRGNQYTNVSPRESAERVIDENRVSALALERYFDTGLDRFWTFPITKREIVEHAEKEAIKRTKEWAKKMVKEIIEEMCIVDEDYVKKLVEEVIQEEVKKIVKKTAKKKGC